MMEVQQLKKRSELGSDKFCSVAHVVIHTCEADGDCQGSFIGNICENTVHTLFHPHQYVKGIPNILLRNCIKPLVQICG